MPEGEKQTEYFTMTPYSVLGRSDLSWAARALYGLIYTLSQKSGYCFMSNSKMAALMGTTTKYVSRLVAELADAGLVRAEITVSSGNARRLYPIHHLVDTYPTDVGYLGNNQGIAYTTDGTNPIPQPGDHSIYLRRKEKDNQNKGASALSDFSTSSFSDEELDPATFYLIHKPPVGADKWDISREDYLEKAIADYGRVDVLAEMSRRYAAGFKTATAELNESRAKLYWSIARPP